MRYASPLFITGEPEKSSRKIARAGGVPIDGRCERGQRRRIMPDDAALNKEVAENNGLACESTWIPVEQGKKYRFAVNYHSTGPTARIFLKGFAFKPDQFGDKNDPEAVRREFYRKFRCCRVPRMPAGRPLRWISTPSTGQINRSRIEWLRVDLFIYLKPGDVFFDDVVVKKLDE